MVVFGLFWTITAAGMGAPGFFPLLGLVLIGFGVAGGWAAPQKSKAFQARKERYEANRVKVLNELRSRKGSE